MKDFEKYINTDPEIYGGKPVFSGTRVPVQTLFWHLEEGIPLEVFLDDFPSVSKEQALGVMKIANEILGSKKAKDFYETVA